MILADTIKFFFVVEKNPMIFHMKKFIIEILANYNLVTNDPESYKDVFTARE